METNPVSYEEAAQSYLAKFRSLIQPLQDTSGTEPRGAVELPSEILVQRAEEIACISDRMIRLAQAYLSSANPREREGIRHHFIDQAILELLLGIELLQVSEESTSTAAIKATHGAAFREAVSEAEKSSSASVTQGLREDVSCRANEAATISEAIAGLNLAAETATDNIAHRVQELGGEIAYDLVSGTEWREDVQRVLSSEAISTTLETTSPAAAANLLLQVYRKVSALMDAEMVEEARLKIRGWLVEMRRAGRTDGFSALIDGFYRVEKLKKCVSELERSAVPVDSINRSSDLIKRISDRFTVLTARMRKLEEAIRLGKPVEVPQFRLLSFGLQVNLLSALVYAGRDSIETGLAGALRETGSQLLPQG